MRAPSVRGTARPLAPPRSARPPRAAPAPSSDRTPAPSTVTATTGSTFSDDDAPPIAPDRLRDAGPGAQVLERAVGESSVDYLSVRAWRREMR